MAVSTLTVKYTGTNVGKIYLSDVDKRRQLGGAPENAYISGQDEYLQWGETKVLQITDDVLYSRLKGILKYFSTAASSAAFVNGAPLTLIDGTDTTANEVPRQDIGDTGSSRFIDSYMTTLGLQFYSTGIAGATGYYYGNVL